MSAKVIQIWRKVRAQWPYLPQTLRLVWEAAQHRTLIWAVLLLLQGLLPLLLVYLTRSLVNSLVTAINATASPETVHPTLTLVILLAALLLLTEVLRSVTRYVRTSQTERVQDHVNHLIHQKSIAVDLAFYESPDYYDRLHRARAEAKYRPAALLENIGSLFQNAITLVAMVAILAPFGIWLPAALVASTLPALFVVLYYSTREHEWRRRTTVDERRSWYYDWLLTVKESAAEVRLFGLAPYFQAAYQRLRRRLRRERLELLKQESLAELAAAAFALLVMGTALAWMVWKTVQGGTTLGDLALFYQAFYLGQRLMRSLLENVGNVYSNSLFLSNLFEFLELEPRVISPSQPLTSPLVLKQGLCFQGVTFRYPRSGRAVLHDFNLNLPAGEVAAVVGPNGAGKSTLIKLICRFYDPQEGHIELDGVDLRKLALEELRERIAVLFQEPMHYNTTAARNIALGDLMNPPDESQIRETARAAGAHQTILKLPKGYETVLGKWFAGGTELSVGEWQRIALARAFLRRAPLILLDEPTSALDSWAEADWFDRFRTLAAGRTALIITHRFSTARGADIIHVMEEGRVVESGTHRELVALGGRYAEGMKAADRL